MSNWKETLETQICCEGDTCEEGCIAHEDRILKLIETEIIEKLIEDISAKMTVTYMGDPVKEYSLKAIKQQLRAKWLGERLACTCGDTVQCAHNPDELDHISMCGRCANA